MKTLVLPADRQSNHFDIEHALVHTLLYKYVVLLNTQYQSIHMSSSKKYDFTGKVALVTGSSSGIGAEIAKQFAQYGASVAITGRNADNLARVAEEVASVSGVKPLQVVGDLLDDAFPEKLITTVIEHFKKLDILVNNAGGTVPNGGLSSEKLLEEFDQTIKLNLRAPVELIQRAAPYLKKEKGNIIQISSVASTKPWTLSYSSAKAGLDMATRCAALELGTFGVRVNSINPGPVETSFHRSMGLDNDAFKGFATFFKENSLLKYIGQPEDVANLASFLASDLARNITGSIYFTDSGSLLHTPEFKK